MSTAKPGDYLTGCHPLAGGDLFDGMLIRLIEDVGIVRTLPDGLIRRCTLERADVVPDSKVSAVVLEALKTWRPWVPCWVTGSCQAIGEGVDAKPDVGGEEGGPVRR